jgi:hypothetical protein
MGFLQAVASMFSDNEESQDPPQAAPIAAPAYTTPPPPQTEPQKDTPHETEHPPQKSDSSDSAAPFLGLF